eukprot:maker-scaffold21_size687808-snap-gene-1.15 protein:Tk09831 transcript:maker-scaffold21_size687808-snap-gene-1.15-mRNA-1 annotation:"hsp90 co-chaperone cdc37"
MARPIDYSKWKDIEISDDEDDTHPNIDTPSLFKWRHEARVQRMQEQEDQKKVIQAEKDVKERKLKELKDKVTKAADQKDSSLDTLKKSLAEVEAEAAEAEKKKREIDQQERLQPWNVDTISKEGFSKTIVNKPVGKEKNDMTEEEREQFMREFVKKYEKEIKHYGWLKKFDDSKAYLMEHNHLACEDTANYLVIQCINLAMEEKFAAMEQIAHQTIAMQYLLELAKQLEMDPRACISSFFTKIQVADDQYKQAFNDELEGFKQRIRRRAKEKVQEQLAEIEEEERLERLGPGGLDPLEVIESLPEALRECFESQDTSKLQQVIRDMDPQDARIHMKRCVDSGLWKPAADDPNTNPEDGFKRREAGDEDDEEVYEEIPAKN